MWRIEPSEIHKAGMIWGGAAHCTSTRRSRANTKTWRRHLNDSGKKFQVSHLMGIDTMRRGQVQRIGSEKRMRPHNFAMIVVALVIVNTQIPVAHDQGNMTLRVCHTR
jgi:hypothetical protein